ncbi:MAG: carboxypeptidase regulatory-like domain-containing protein, partial [Myxococcota bacterium]
DELARELAESPARVAPGEFIRIGAVWDAEAAQSLEISISSDGNSWSSWQPLTVLHMEAENVGSFVGELSAPEGASLYRLRSVGTVPTFLSMEFLELDFAGELEDGQDPGFAEHLFEQAGLAAGVNNRSSWGARSARCVSAHSPYRLTIHHTVTPTVDSLSPEARLRQIQSFHQDVRGWCDVGYHFLVSRDGRLWEGRPSGVLGSHVGGANSGNVGVSFMGTHDSTPITDTQLNKVAGLIDAVTDQYGISISSTTIKGHRDRGSTSCPGNALYAQLPELIARAQSGGGPVDPPPPTSITVKGLIYEGSDTSARIAGATITMGSRSTTSSSSGYYEFTGVAPGTYEITASKAGFVSRTISRQASDSETWASISLSADLPVGTAILQGVVYTGNDSSNRVGNAAIQLSTGHSFTADANGYFRITDLPPGPVTISASAPGFPTRSVQRTLSNGVTTWGSVNL